LAVIIDNLYISNYENLYHVCGSNMMTNLKHTRPPFIINITASFYV